MAGTNTQNSEMAGRYASAVFSLANEEGKEDQVTSDLNLFLETLENNPELNSLAKSQAISAKDKLAAITTLTSASKMDVTSANFLRLIASKGRLQSVEDIIYAYNALVLEQRNELKADITVAKEMTKEQSQALSATLNEKFNKSVDMNIMVDPTILGGIIIKVGSKMIDNSLRTKLNNLKIAMKEVG